ncbi:MAG TPA: MaoC/PaaZ C-terminal domain-containing protein [Candidatus Dormibacteraeota bacterium]|nr:MaoC/PaaZ C-terminal domain-containing protein [Candidatus Dormibacteraeota bacterium]
MSVVMKVGDEIPELVKRPTTQQLVQYAGASGDFYQIHYDQDFARSVGLPGVILHGLLKAAYLGQLLTDWVGDTGTLQSLEVSYRGIDVPGKPYRCRGRITKVDGKNVDVEVWGEDESGQKTTLGSATVEFD